MITEYLPIIFGSTSLLLGVWLLSYSFKLYKPKHKTNEENEKYNNWHKKFGTFSKIASIILILNGGYDLLNHNSDRYKINSSKKSEWTEEDRQVMIENCLRDAKTNTTKYPQIMKDYCECSVDKIIAAFTKEKYLESLKKTQEEQITEQLPIFQSCLDDLKIRIDSVEKVENDTIVN